MMQIFRFRYHRPHLKAICKSPEVDIVETAVMVQSILMMRRSLTIVFLSIACCGLLPANNAMAQFIEYKITASDGDPNDRFGESVAIDGNTAVIGAFRDDDAGGDAGAAYVFDFSNGVWSQTSKLIPDDGSILPGFFDNGLFGGVADIRNDVIVVGAVDSRENGIKKGAAYVFGKTAEGEWVQQEKLVAFDGALDDKFGATVATNGDFAFVGALDADHSNLGNAGAVYVYRRNIQGDADATWTFTQKLIPSDAQAGDSFGWSVDLSEDRAVIGARDDDDSAENAGAAYVYEFDGSQWIQITKIYAGDARQDDSFGEVVAIHDDQIIVGARDVDTNGEEAGAAYIFELQNDASWQQTAKLLASDGESLDRFGNSVTIDGNYAIVSTRIDNDFSGAIYVFQKIGGSWIEVSKVTPQDLEAGDLFGQAVNISGTFVISGTKGDDKAGLDAGAAHIFDLTGSDRGALIALYNATNGPNWSRKNNWLSNAPVNTWYGVNASDDGQIIEIDLENNNLNGELPVAIGGFPFLRRISLRDNNLTGQIPEEIALSSNLEVIDLGENNLTSEIPASLADMAVLQNLFLDNNEFTGIIPDAFSQIENLEVLYLNNNQFSGAVSEKLTGLESLRVLRLQANQLTDLPDFASSGTQNELNDLFVFNNLFTFEDLEPNVNINEFQYSPQANVGEARTLIITENNPLLIQIEVGGDQNIYQWKKNGSPIPDTNSDTFVIPSVTESDAGVYTLEVTNQIVSDLTIFSESITVNVISVVEYASNLSSIHVIPPLLSPANGNIAATLVGSQLIVSGSFEQLTFPVGAAYVHIGAPGVTTDPVITLAISGSGQEGIISEENNQYDLNDDQLIALQNGLFYITIASESGSISNPLAPELRGQLYATPNTAPEETTITAPGDGTEINLGDAGNIDIEWNAVSDAQGHPVDYLWAFSRNNDFENNSDLIDGIFRTGKETSFSISHENLDAFLAAQGIGQGESVTLYHLVASSDGSRFSTSSVFSMNLIRSTTNQAPRVNNPIVDFTYVLEDGPGSIGLPDVFMDPDGDDLQFSTNSSNTGIAQAAIESESLVLTPIAIGTTTITIEAKDSFDASATDEFILTINSRPAVANTISNLTLFETDDAVNLSLMDVFTDADPLTYAVESSTPDVLTLSLIDAGSTLQVAPASVGIADVTVTAEDSQGAMASTTFQVVVQADMIMPPQSVSEQINISFGNAELSASYRLVALPGNVNLPMATAVNGMPEDDWIAYRDNGQDINDREVYFERYNNSANFNFTPGSGFWLLSKLTWERSEARPTVALAQDGSFTIPLQSGWNIISNPFDIDVPWQAVSQINQLTQQIYRWDGRYIAAPVFSSASSGDAYYYFNSEELNEIRIPYLPATAGNSARLPIPALQIVALSSTDTLSTIRAGRHPLAEEGTDALDQIAPPEAFEEAGLRFVRKGIQSGSRQGFLSEEFLPADARGYRYEIALHAQVNEPLVLNTSGYENFEDHQEIILFDSKLAKRYDLRKNPSLTFWPNSTKQEFVLLIGDAAYIDTEQASILPDELVLLPNYPNPFTERTTLEFALPEPSRIRLVVYNALGRQVRLLSDGDYDAGHHQIQWSGVNDAGTPLSSGLYFYRLQLQDTQIVRSMILRR
ncbi:MAG: leucine-rich repeat domain-containing protein [Rhodothermales bacterium]